MKRKVNKIGPATLMVSLPAKWVKKYGVKKGDELEVEEKNQNLVIASSIKEEEKSINIKLESSEYKFIRALIRNLYIHGFEHIRIEYKSSVDYASISKAINDLGGYEITKESSDRCTIENISEIKAEQFGSFYNKQFQLILFMQDLVERALEEGANDDDKAIMDSLNKKSSKYACICRRILIRNKLMNNDDAIIKFYVINLIHMIARNYANCYNHLYNNKLNVSKEIISFANDVNKLFKELYNLHMKKKVLNITEKREGLLRDKLPGLFKNTKDGMIIYYLAEIVRLIGTSAPKIEIMNDFLED